MQRQVEQDEFEELVGEPSKGVLALSQFNPKPIPLLTWCYWRFFRWIHRVISLDGTALRNGPRQANYWYIHLARLWSPWKNTIGEDLSELLDADLVTQISAGEKAITSVLVLCNPYVVRHPVDGLPEFKPDRVEVLCGSQIAAAEIFDGFRRIMPTAGDIEDVFYAPCEWVAN